MKTRWQLKRDTITSSPDEMIKGVIETVHIALQQAGATSEEIVGIGVGVPGQVDPASGEVRLAVNLRLTAYPLGRMLSSEFKAPIAVENDVRLAAMGVYHGQEKHDSVSSLAYLSIGTGVSAGIVLNGVVHRGASGMAGEIGHIVMDEDGAICNCGQRGCLETIVAGPGIARQAAEAGLNTNSLTIIGLYALAQNGDSRAANLIKLIGRYVARAVQWLVMAYDVEKVVLGGGVTSAGPKFLDTVLSELSLLRAQSELAQMMLPDSKLSLLPADFSAGTQGAIWMAQDAANHNRQLT